MTNLEALKTLYAAAGGQDDITGATTLVEVLNAIAAIFGGEETAGKNAEAIAAIADALANSGGDGVEI